MTNKIIVNVTDRKNKKHILEGEKGQTLMQLIDQYDIAYPYGVCGGFPDCGTCHVYVDEKWLNKLSIKTSEEESAMENSSQLKNNSRLGCQIDLTEELNGLTVTIGPNENQPWNKLFGITILMIYMSRQQTRASGGIGIRASLRN